MKENKLSEDEFSYLLSINQKNFYTTLLPQLSIKPLILLAKIEIIL